MKIFNEPKINTAKVAVVKNYIKDTTVLRQYVKEMKEEGISPQDVIWISLFDKDTKSFNINDFKSKLTDLEILLRSTSINILIDDTYILKKSGEGFKKTKSYIFSEIFGRDTSKWDSLGILEEYLIPEGQKRKFISSFRWQSIKREMESSKLINSEFKLNIKDFNIKFIKTVEEAKEAFKAIRQDSRLYGDLETNTLRFERKDAKILTFAWTPRNDRLTSYVFAYDHPKVITTKEYKEYIEKNLKQLMTKRNTVFHNGLFDLKFICRFLDINPFDTNMDDTFVIARILKNNTLSSDERRESVSLKSLAFPLVGDWEVPLEKRKKEIIKQLGIKKDDFDYSMYDIDELVKYAGIDTIVMPFVDDMLQELNAQHPVDNPIKDCWESYWKEITVGIVQLMLNGMPLRKEACKDMIKSHQNELDKIMDKILNDSATKKTEEILNEEQWEKALKEYNKKVQTAQSKGKEFKGKPPQRELGKYGSINYDLKFKPTSTNHKAILLYDVLGMPNGVEIKTKDGTKYSNYKKFDTVKQASDFLKISPKDLRKYLRGFNKRNVKDNLYVNYITCTDTGLPETGNEIFTSFYEQFKDIKILSLFKGYANIYKELNTYLLPWLEFAENSFDGRIHSTFSPDTTSFRWASTSPNLQQIPKDSKIRDVLGYERSDKRILMSQDFSALEVIININYCKDKFSIDLFNKGIDDEHAVNLIQSAYASEKFKAVRGLDPLNKEHLKKVKNEFPMLRKKIKSAVTFPMTYLASPMAVKMGLDCTQEEAEDIWNSWWDNRQGYRDWVNMTFQKFKNQGYTTVLGNVPLIAEYNTDLEGIETLADLMKAKEVSMKNKDTDRKEYLNKVIKSLRTFINAHGQSGAILTNLGMTRLMKYSRENNLDCIPCNTVHDDLIVDVSIKDLDKAYHKQKEFMTLPYLDDQELPVNTDAELGYTNNYELGEYEEENRLKLIEYFKKEIN